MELSENAKKVLENRYLRKDENGNVIENFEQMFRRVAHFIAQAERNYNANPKDVEEIFYNMMAKLEFLPNSPTLMNAGTSISQLAACFVIPIEDSMEGIFDAVKNAAITHKSGGGTGFSFSHLRSKNSVVKATGGIASGPVSFMKVFNTATEQVKQGSRRRGANIGLLNIDHPDILEFIKCKTNNNELNNFNISVGVTDAFMKAVKENKEYNLIDPHTKQIVQRINAQAVYKELIENAWVSGDPGIIFLDTVNRANPTPQLGLIEASNPCGETPLLNFEACNLGSINLAKFVKNGEVNYKKLQETVHNAIRFLDNTIDMSVYPLPQINEMVRGNRKIGLGIMGFADLLFQLQIPYNSNEGLKLAETLMKFIHGEAWLTSEKLAKERGPFPNIKESVFEKDVRNATVTTIAPTGTLSIIANCSSGIEPLFALSFTRNVLDNTQFTEVNKYFEEAAKERGFHTTALMQKIAETGRISQLKEVPDDVKKVFITSHDISPEWHVKMQAAFQKYTDNAVSKTVNLPKTATIEDVKQVYDLAYELGCKGVTIYRDGSKAGQVLSIAQDKTDGFAKLIQDRPEVLEGFTTKAVTGLGNLYVTVTEYEGRPFEVFATIGKSGKSTTAKTEAIGRLISLCFRFQIPVAEVVEQLKGICGEHPIFQTNGMVLSIPDAIGKILEKRYLAKTINVNKNDIGGSKCPECGKPISFEEGCMTCHACGYSKCS